MSEVSNTRNADHVSIFLSAQAGDRDHVSVVVDVELTTTSQESHLGDHLSVAVIQPQWVYHKKSEQQPSPLVDPKCRVQLECKSLHNENFVDGNRLMSPLSSHKPFVVPMEQVPYLLFSFFISGVVAGTADKIAERVKSLEMAV